MIGHPSAAWFPTWEVPYGQASIRTVGTIVPRNALLEKVAILYGWGCGPVMLASLLAVTRVLIVPPPWVGGVIVASAVYLLPVVVYSAYTNVLLALWWLLKIIGRSVRRPASAAAVGALAIVALFLFLWIAPRVNRDSGQFEFVVIAVLVLSVTYRAASGHRWRQPRT
jgi:hypothetical protein